MTRDNTTLACPSHLRALMLKDIVMLDESCRGAADAERRQKMRKETQRVIDMRCSICRCRFSEQESRKR